MAEKWDITSEVWKAFSNLGDSQQPFTLLLLCSLRLRGCSHVPRFDLRLLCSSTCYHLESKQPHANFQNVRLNLICKIVIPVRKKQTRISISFQSWQGYCRDEQIKMLVCSQAFKGKLAADGAVTNACGKINIPRRQAVKCD